jgi:hypothetical protein
VEALATAVMLTSWALIKHAQEGTVSFASECHDAEILLSEFLFEIIFATFSATVFDRSCPCVHNLVSWKGSRAVMTVAG